MRRGLAIESIDPGSPAAEAGLETGDRLLTVNGHTIRDLIDYAFHSGDGRLLLEVAKKNGELLEIELDWWEGEPLGIRFAPPRPARCSNACLFCFVDQLPSGLRAPLYVKDEDYRLSFLYGNFITLASIGRGQLRRIREQRLSPLYISVHATDPVVRGLLLGNPSAPPVLPIMEELASAGIRMHAQVVLCPGLNDGRHLERTVSDLAALYPAVASLAVVPVGLTRHRASLARLRPVTRRYATRFMARWLPRAEELADRLGSPFLFLADEFFIKAEFPFPPLAAYGDLPQLENGVGMVPLFLAEAEEVLERAEPLGKARVTVVTGQSPYRYLARFVSALAERTGIDIRAVAVANQLFGEGVTVTGLVPGNGILDAFKGREARDLLAVPDVMLKEGEGLFVDDVSIEELGAKLDTEVAVFEATPSGLYEMLKGHFAG